MTEQQLHLIVTDYLRLKHPGVIFRTDWGAGARITPGQRVQHKRLQQDKGYPDLFIAEPRSGFHGLFIEIKKEGTRIKRKDGEYVSNEHIRQQATTLYNLSCRGYVATFGIGFDHIVQIIDEYLRLPKPNYSPPEWSIELPEPKKEVKSKEVF